MQKPAMETKETGTSPGKEMSNTGEAKENKIGFENTRDWILHSVDDSFSSDDVAHSNTLAEE